MPSMHIRRRVGAQLPAYVPSVRDPEMDGESIAEIYQVDQHTTVEPESVPTHIQIRKRHATLPNHILGPTIGIG